MPPETPSARCPQCGKTFPSTVKLCPDDGSVLESKHDPMAAQLGKVLDGKYRLDSFLSQGGMGAVFKATHVMLGKTVAVKLINPELVTSADVVRRFQREARAATALNHPNIVAVYDLGQTPEGTLYIAMEFVDGPSLKSVIVSGGPMAPGRTIAILRQVTSALATAHRHKIVHRDLKPHNIMLARGGAEGRHEEIVKLVDFGIAKTFDDATQLTTAGDAIGTPHYMAPEQAAGAQVDARSDLYSLGVIVYEMMTGEVPFNDNSTAAILVKHLKDVPERPSLRNPRVPIAPELEAIALKCLEKDPAARYQTAEEVDAALEHAAASIPSIAMQADVTMPMAAAAALPLASEPTVRMDRSAPTQPSAAAPPPPSPPAAGPAKAAPVAPVPPSRPSGDTRPTVMNQPSAAAAAMAPPPPSKSSNKGLVLGFVVLAVLLVGAGVYMNRPATPAQTTASDSTAAAPSAVPASALGSDSGAPAAAATPPADPSSNQAASSSAAAGASAGPAAPAPAAAASAPAPASTASTPSPAPASTASASAPASGSRAASSLTAKVVPPPAAPAPGAAKGAVSKGAPVASGAPIASAPAASAQPAAATRPASGGDSPRPAPPAAAFPESPAVFFHCNGAPDICSPLRAAVDDALEKSGFSSVRSAARADIDVAAQADVVQENANRQFGTTFAVRNYSIDVSGQTTRTNEVVSMPPPTSVSFDAQFGSERGVEKARSVAGDIVDRVKAFVRKKRGA